MAPNTRTLPSASEQIIQGDDDPLWYKDAIIYELHVRSFFDSREDGVGDFRGLTRKLDYLVDLGVTALWLLPFYPSPLRDDGYDIAGYSTINPAYGTMRDFKEFLREAHRRSLKVITELVINHTSDQHPWFQRARQAPPGSVYRDFYVWSEKPDKYLDARIIFKDFEPSNWSWDPVAKAYYWHRFFSHQPDLNFDNTRVHDALMRVMDFWFRMGVDGMRLDAIPYLYEREGTSCENLPETHVFLKKLRAHIDERFPNRMLLAEANQWPEDTVPYFGDGDECHMGFHFPVMPRLFMSIRMEDRFPIVDILRQTPPIPPNAQWATFLRNHDELTLEMVTDEERDYMYRVYASDLNARINLGIRRRLAPLLGNDRRTIELMNSLLFSLPGTPVLYYGDEIGMGDNIYLGDRNGVRTPMQWSGDRNAGFSKANPQKLFLPVIVDPEYHYETLNVEAQQRNTNSLLWWMRRFTALRKQYRAFGRGTIEFLAPDNRKVLAFVRAYEEERILVVVNLSRLVQFVELDLSQFVGATPVELFGRTEFPQIGDRPLFLTLGPHAFYWFLLQQQSVATRSAEPQPGHEPTLYFMEEWRAALAGGARTRFASLVPEYMRRQRWFQGKARPIRSASVADLLPLGENGNYALALIEIDYVDGDPELYALPLGFATGGDEEQVRRQRPRCIVARSSIRSDGGGQGVVYDAATEPAAASALLELITGRRRVRGNAGELEGDGSLPRGIDTAALHPMPMSVDQSNTSIRYGDTVLLKLFRRVEDGESLDLELGRFLTERGFIGAPRVMGALEYRKGDGSSRTVGVLQEFIANEGNAWRFTLDSLGTFYEQVSTSNSKAPQVRARTADLIAFAHRGPDALAQATIGSYLEDARVLGRRTAEMHVALASGTDQDFAPESFTLFYQRSLYQSMRNLAGRVFLMLARQRGSLAEDVQKRVDEILTLEERLFARFKMLIDHKIDAVRIRVHGDYHLGQVLFTGNNFIITDFEGEPARALSERRLKRNPLRDVAGMIRSFEYAASTALRTEWASAAVSSADTEMLASWSRFWYAWVSAAFIQAYLEIAQPAGLVPTQDESLHVLLDSYLLEKAVYEIGYELNNRPDWLVVPAEGLLQLLRT
jgi:maltose alpha-D-glucosyltransferase/alpha-amylase